MRLLVLIGAVLLSPAAHALTKYEAVFFPYSVAAAPFTTSQGVSGEFVVAAPLAANLVGADLRPLLLAFQFSNGVQTFVQGDPDVRVQAFTVITDGAGAIVGWNINILRWTSGSFPHQPGDALDLVLANLTFFVGSIGATCSAIGPDDTCNSLGAGPSGSGAGPGGSWSRSTVTAVHAAQPVSVVSGPLAAMLAALLGAVALATIARRRPGVDRVSRDGPTSITAHNCDYVK